MKQFWPSYTHIPRLAAMPPKAGVKEYGRLGLKCFFSIEYLAGFSAIAAFTYLGSYIKLKTGVWGIDLLFVLLGTYILLILMHRAILRFELNKTLLE